MNIKHRPELQTFDARAWLLCALFAWGPVATRHVDVGEIVEAGDLPSIIKVPYRLSRDMPKTCASREALYEGVTEDQMWTILRSIHRVSAYEFPRLMSGPVSDPSVAVINNQGVILYNSRRLSTIRKKAGRWGLTFVLAHEVGHLLNADPWRNDREVAEGNQNIEILADKFAAIVLCRLGATLEQTTLIFSVYPSNVKASHPDVLRRIQAVQLEYLEELKRIESSCLDYEEVFSGRCVARCRDVERGVDGSCFKPVRPVTCNFREGGSIYATLIKDRYLFASSSVAIRTNEASGVEFGINSVIIVTQLGVPSQDPTGCSGTLPAGEYRITDIVFAGVEGTNRRFRIKVTRI